MTRLLGFLVVFAVAGPVFAQGPFQAYQATFPIGGVPVNMLLIKPNVYPPGMSPSYGGWGISDQTFDPKTGIPIPRQGCVATLYEAPIATGAVMTIVKMNLSAGFATMAGADNTLYEAAPPLSGNITVHLVGANVWARFPPSINLVQTTANAIP